MNLLILTGTHGAYNSVRPEAEIFISLAKLGHAITIMTQEDSVYATRFKEYGIEVIDTKYDKKFSLSLVKKVKEVIKKNSIEIVYATNSKSISNAIIACMGLEVKLVTYRGTTGGLYRYDPSAYLNALNPRVDGVVCVSEAVRERVAKQIFDSSKAITIYKGHEVSWYEASPANLEEFCTNKESFNIAFVANVRPHKGLIYLLEAAMELSKYKDIHILLIGENISKEPYLTAIKESNMQERIHSTGFREDAPQIIAACSVLVQASIRKEGLSRVLLESLASKTPVIATAIGANLEVIEDGFNGFIVPVQDSHAIAKGVIELYENREKLQELSANCTHVLEHKMSHMAGVLKYDAFFKALLERK